jgi:hypothetical protein
VKLWERRAEERDIDIHSRGCGRETAVRSLGRIETPRTGYVYLQSSSLLSRIFSPSLQLTVKKFPSGFHAAYRAQDSPISIAFTLHHPWHAYRTAFRRFRRLPLAVHLSLDQLLPSTQIPHSGAPSTASLLLAALGGHAATLTPEPRR